jgi:putative ABC transport system permease protein
MVISETGAKRLFGNEDPVGKTISVKHRWATNDQEVDVIVTGVYKDYPSNSHFKPKYIINVNAFKTLYGNDFTYYMEGTGFDQRRNLGFFQSYITLKPGADLKPISATLNKLASQMIQSDSFAAANNFKMSAFLTK